jgi:hypothetical protein
MSVSNISLAPISKDSIKSSLVLSWAFTPGKSTSHPIHQPLVPLITALNFIDYLTRGLSSDKLHKTLVFRCVHRIGEPHRLSLGGLLSSRARFRPAGSISSSPPAVFVNAVLALLFTSRFELL